jgi:hypothetical protein
MTATIRSTLRARCARGRLATTTIALVALLLLPAITRGADEPGPMVVVPASPVALEIAVPLDPAVKLDRPARWQLVEVDDSSAAVPVQLVRDTTEDGLAREGAERLVAVVPPRQGAEGPRRFAPRPVGNEPADAGSSFRLEATSDASLGLWDGDSPVLVYNHGMIVAENVPENDPRRTRSCYIHPLHGLSGEVLTEDFPRDHYHHHGVFWTWPHVRIDGREYDLWTDRGIKQRFVRWLGREGGPVAGVIGVENAWFTGDQKVMIERIWIRAYKAGGDTRSIDLEFTWVPVDKPITLWGAGGKSYGGLTVRFAPPSRKDPSTVITVPSGPTTGDLPDTPLAWADFTSKFGDCPHASGAAIFVPPSHPDYPPTWLTRHYGPLCVGWPGVHPKTFAPGKPIRLSYRVWIHKTAVETGDIQRAYDAYQAALETRWQ